MPRHCFFIFTVFLIISVGYVASAQTSWQLMNQEPVYDPVAKRYFAMMRLPAGFTEWNTSAEYAESLIFMGVRGRLAIVDSIEIHEFLLRTFHPNQYQYEWFGLRYLCRQKQLQWSDGTFWKPGSFQAWDFEWKQDIYFCASDAEWSPVAYGPAFTWIGKGVHKGYEFAFIEFPTGHP